MRPHVERRWPHEQLGPSLKFHLETPHALSLLGKQPLTIPIAAAIAVRPLSTPPRPMKHRPKLDITVGNKIVPSSSAANNHNIQYVEKIRIPSKKASGAQFCRSTFYSIEPSTLNRTAGPGNIDLTFGLL
ncbi:hypothetical protein AGIG_G15488 [Arapaima gigas]